MVNDENPLRTASALAQAGRTAEAIACLESALARTRPDKERPANASILARTAGLLCEEVGRLSQAALYYEEAVATAEGEPLLLLALADVRWRSGQADSARSCLARAESMAQSSADADAVKMVANLRARWANEDR
ncbi:tetratricopeptide repeat protein [Myxococcus sp. CA051A]|uniref:tetratricopeptide repeat protein n=1 Tax=Myxococcus sp. CA051A TaxID=2741739 RepID=UPI00157B6E6B|nr:tetratricopeptide repeat protein [Myxococcus sp. CA051A]NTX61325.1 tetratricopeptide repeat protein [Myxococcus sp. CA051A]